MRKQCLFLLMLVVAGCGGDGSSPSAAASPPSDTLRQDMRAAGVTGEKLARLAPIRPSQDAHVRLGQILFFSASLSGRFDVACATCHHPQLSGGDGLTLPIGVAASVPHTLGLGRTLDPAQDLAPNADFGPNVPRNSQTVFNTGLYDRALFHDGRVFVTDADVVPGGAGQVIATPASNGLADPAAGPSLLASQARFPLVSNDEMRGYMYPELASASAYRERLMNRLRGVTDQAYMADDAALNWYGLFQSVHGVADADGQMISVARVVEALAAYQRSMTFTQSPWRAFVEGDDGALDEQALIGARLFFAPLARGGLGCAACHAGDTLTSEQFFNAGFPQVGRGKRTDGSDHGRADVSTFLRQSENEHAFRVPSLLNVAATAPYGHAGTFANLRDLLRYHANPRQEVDQFDFDLSALPQAQLAGVPATEIYPEAEALTRAAIAASSFGQAESLLPQRLLTEAESDALEAFLNALTDPCVASDACLEAWVPDGVDDDPDGNLLVRDQPFDPDPGGGGGPALPPPPVAYPASLPMSFPTGLAVLDQHPGQDGCTTSPSAVPNTGDAVFLRRDVARGLTQTHGFSADAWLAQAGSGNFELDETLQAGGVSAAYINADCWVDVIMAAGDASDGDQVALYLNDGAQSGFSLAAAPFDTAPDGLYTSVSIADLNGDYRPELVLANLHQSDLEVLALNDSGKFTAVASLPMGRSTFGIAFADTDGQGYPDLYLAHWSANGLPGTAPAFWQNQSGTTLVPSDDVAGTDEGVVAQGKNFAPGFADLDNDGDLDLAIASDFQTSLILENDGAGVFARASDIYMIDDRNGMGAALQDLDNDGWIDWFVTSIEVPEPYDWDGNRLYQNEGASSAEISFATEPLADGVNDGGWAWGACAADFDNDGLQDLVHVNGYGRLPADLAAGPLAQYAEIYDFYAGLFADQPVRLFMNQGNFRFVEAAAGWQLTDVSEGRGVVCLDYDRDGDMDILLLDHSRGLQLHENQSGSSVNRFLSVRLSGLAPNTQALGARVTVLADTDGDDADEQQTQTASANSNFASQNPPDLHFGVGSADLATVEVAWPGGGTTRCEGLTVNRFLVLSEAGGNADCP